MEEELSKFYVASIVLALEYLHNNSITFRDLKVSLESNMEENKDHTARRYNLPGHL